MMDFFDDFFYPRQTLSLAPSFYYPTARPRYRIEDFSDFFDEDDYEVFYPRKKVKPVRIPQLHLAEEKKGWIATVLLPGVTSFKDITLDLDEDVLRIRAEARRRYQRQTYTHSLLLPHGSDKSQIKASFKGETLTVVIPRMEEKEKLEAAPEQKVESSTSSENKPQEAPVAESSKKTENSVTEQKPEPVSVEAKQQPQQAVAKRSLFMMPKVSHRQTETHNVIAVEFPENWAAKEDLDVEVSNSLLNISFAKKENGASFTFRRSVSLPPNVTEQDITAKFENNTLLVSYPKPTPPKTFKIPLSVGDSFQQQQLDSSSTQQPEQQPEQQPSETSSQTVETSNSESGDMGSESTTNINLEPSETQKEPVTVESA